MWLCTSALSLVGGLTGLQPDADLEDFVLAKPGSSKKARFAKPLSETQMTDLEKGPVVPNTEKVRRGR